MDVHSSDQSKTALTCLSDMQGKKSRVPDLVAFAPQAAHIRGTAPDTFSPHPACFRGSGDQLNNDQQRPGRVNEEVPRSAGMDLIYQVIFKKS